MPHPPIEEVHRDMTPDERAAVMLQLGIMIQEVAGSYELGVEEVIIRYLIPELEAAEKRLAALFKEMDDIDRMFFFKNPDTQKWRLAIAWKKDLGGRKWKE